MKKIEPKQLFVERIGKLIPDEKDREKFWEYARKKTRSSIRSNTLKIKPEELIKILEDKGWTVSQPFQSNPEIMIIESKLGPGELGKTIEHLLGLYYVQELSSMMPAIALNPKPGELVLDLTAAPGSKTTQMVSLMENKGTIIANDKTLDRTNILAANLERCGCSNVVMVRHDAVLLCERLQKLGIKFDKVLLDLPCSGEGNTRSNEKTFLMWNIKMVEKLSRMQRKIASSAVSLLKQGGELVYSTCTQSPEENERNVSFLAREFDLEIEKAEIPLKCRPGVLQWGREKYSEKINLACRIYPQDNDTEGFFLCKMKKK